MYGGAWKAAVDGVTKESKSRTRQSDFTFTFHFHALEKEMATHASILAWRIPGTEESVGLSSTGSHRVRHDWHDLAAEAAPPPRPPPFWTLFHLPPHKISLGCSRALALGALICALSLHWSFHFTYGNLHVSVLFSQIIPPSPSPTESKSLFFTSLSPFVALHVGSLVPSFYIPYTCINIQHLSFSFWLISLCIIDSRLIYLIITDKRGDIFAKYGTK